MWFLYAMSWVATVIQFIFVTLAVATGLYYLAELVEEYTVQSRKVILCMTIGSIGLYIGLLLFEDVPFSIIACGVLSQMCHLIVLKTFPFFMLTSPSFIGAVFLFFFNHYLAFSFFQSTIYTFSEVIGYLTLCVWMVPFALFVSLSANDYILPTVETKPLIGGDDNDVVTNYFSKKGKKYGLLSLFQYVKENIFQQRSKKVF